MAGAKTLIFSESPLSGKFRFKVRPLTNYAFMVVIFTAVVIGLSLVISGPLVWLADAVAIVVLFYLHFFVMEKRAIGIRCPHCLKHIATNTPWVCGFCQQRNNNIDEFPFVHRCEHCSAEPRAYRCHHRGCGKLIFLTGDELEENCARCVNAPVEDEAAEEITMQDREKRKLEHDLIMTELTAKLNAAKERAAFVQKKTPHEKKKESFEKFHGEIMAAREIAIEQRAAIKERYKDDPELLKSANEAVDEWLRGET